MTTNFAYDGSTMVAEFPGAAAMYHVPGVGYTEGTGVRYSYRENGLGSTVGVLDSSGALVSRSEYDAYGQELVILAGPKSNLRFAGRHGYYKDDSSGLTLLGARYYSAKLGRFLTQDPIKHRGGLNLYAYADNSPLTEIDPAGTQNVTISGDTSGVWYAYLLPDYWGSVNGPSWIQLQDLFLKNKGVTLWGHGSAGAASYNGNVNEYLRADDLRHLARLRTKAGLGKLDFLAIDQCEVLQDNDFLFAALELATEVRGYIQWTIDPKHGYKLGKKMVYRSKVDVIADDAMVAKLQGYAPKKGKSQEKADQLGKHKNLPDVKKGQ